MGKVSMDNFRNNTGLIIITILLAFLVTVGEMRKPEYLSGGGAIIAALVGWPLLAWWFMAFWNRILTKIFKLREISYGVAFVLTGAVTLIF